MSFSSAFIDALKERVPLHQVLGLPWDKSKTNARKGDYWALYPFHAEKTASFHVDDVKGRYYCHGCHVSGDAIEFLMQRKGLAFGEAVAELAKITGVALPAPDSETAAKEARRGSLYPVMEKAQAYFRGRLLDSKAGIMARSVLTDRKISDASAERFGLGYAPPAGLIVALQAQGVAIDAMTEAGLVAVDDKDGRVYERFRDRLMFPIHDGQGRVIAFGGRAMRPDEKAKYLNSPEKPLFHKGNVLYNLHRARERVGETGRLVIAEGYIDGIALDAAGVAAVAVLGTALSGVQLEAAWRLDPSQ